MIYGTFSEVTYVIVCYYGSMKNQVVFGDNLSLLHKLPDECISLIYIDPPFNTGKKQSRKNM